ncbi:hypothetical protein HPL003_16395 [Paenibacillus terrae HPL-003]|uniref:Uncharacterized protein n=1 Tax=Paenibacillus terrae (strain HPL-003) TaxID=985665 RepID=G7W0T8_PAETH|nr:hypothetical protein HPL003_16395 [Paenibacillus terrae HPL-003]
MGASESPSFRKNGRDAVFLLCLHVVDACSTHDEDHAYQLLSYKDSMKQV